MKLPSKKSSSILLLFIFVFQITISGCSKELKIEWSCIQSSKNSMQCDIINKGEVSAEACFDIVQICSNGEHNAHVCSGRINPGSNENKVVTNFVPKIGLFESCMGTEYRNKKFTH